MAVVVVRKAGSSSLWHVSRLSTAPLLALKKPVMPTVKETAPPKKPPGFYSFYVKEKFHEPGLEGTAVDRIKALALKWHSMTDSEKEPYQTQYEAKMREYERKNEVFWQEIPADEFAKYMKGLRKYRRKRKHYLSVLRQQREGKYDPPPRRLPGYNIFMSEKLQQVAEASIDEHRELFSRFAQEWRELSEEERKVYNDKALHLWELKVAQYQERHPEEVVENKEQRKTAKKKPAKATGKTTNQNS